MNDSPVGARRLLTIGAGAALAATLVNAVIYGIGRVAGLDFVAAHTSRGPEHIRLVHVVSLTLITFAIGLAAALIADRFRRPGLRAVQITGGVIALLSIEMDLTIDSTATAKATLATLHLVVGLAFVVALQLARTTHRDTIPAVEGADNHAHPARRAHAA